MSWYRETPTQRLAFQVTVAGAIAFVAYGTFRAWTDYIDPSAPSRDEAAVLSTPLIAGNPVVFFDLELDGKPMGRVTFQLRKDVVPATAENFRKLCTGEPGYGYKGSRIHAVVPGSFLRGGDITHGSGLGGRSASGLPLPDEPHTLRHSGAGVLSMVSPGGPGNATSQFYVALGKSPFMDYQNVVMGNVMTGMEVVHEIEKAFEAGSGGQLTIARSGELRVPSSAKNVRA
ncbi:hypothetical protein FNF27_03760 [Cafeteria roenbergensis]|uniref:Peptidyl-prolyl cis-trans isomerase n=1 Tax=Cafeteria roenbergensis TaxID=33653 RepID=A0A5A8C8R7_CAFRO|nr:hypothetical protein FNF29_06271 [Cafeteria roenbergensis]KAA0160081.1 hypothetical protein FNF31_04539 [Cafeteria roenbergensis]KAA0170996.1 hypothetical protein FNF28_01002 [Cafeteria roenbergensis]KAA0174645.1 hypothetical protein FNF27_03760 [Cafeteria roenbergensis]|eukprot:KAA0148979.1 hypothetical protein FNF29_06271 [Cafeteria roenbergensis]